MGAGDNTQRPCKAPAIAMKHGQRPKVGGMLSHSRRNYVAGRQQVSTTVMVDDALRITGCPGRVIEADGVPLVPGPGPVKLRITVSNKGLVVFVT